MVTTNNGPTSNNKPTGQEKAKMVTFLIFHSKIQPGSALAQVIVAAVTRKNYVGVICNVHAVTPQEMYI